MNQPNEKAADYRHGFVDGASTILRAIGDDLPEEQMRVLERWVSGTLAAWRDGSPDEPRPRAPLIDGA